MDEMYFKEKKRMTKDCTINCMDCKLSRFGNGTKKFCKQFELEHPEKAIAIVEKWAKEHPVKTRMSDFLEKFPRAIVLKYANGEYIDICPVSIDAAINCPNGACKNCRFEYWNEEVEDTDERD